MSNVEDISHFINIYFLINNPLHNRFSYRRREINKYFLKKEGFLRFMPYI